MTGRFVSLPESAMTYVKFVPVVYWNLSRRETFELIDLNAFKVSRDEFNSPDKLFKNLLFSSSFDEVMKTRAIFTWLSFVDVNKFNFNCEKNDKLCKALNCLKFGGSYAEVFMQLASAIGINAICIKGWAKGVDFSGHNPKELPANHSWNAVEIQNKWFLLDCYWSKSISENGIPEMDDFYFFVDPQSLIYSHYPECQRWQLLKVPMSYESFIEMPAYKPIFLKLKLQLKKFFIQDGFTVLTLSHEGGIFFKFKIDKIGDNKCNELQHFVFEELNENSVTYYFRAPEKGMYILKIFASTTGYSFEKDYVIYKEVVDFKILADTSSSMSPVPTATDACWGISKPYLNCIFPQLTSARIHSQERKVDFSITKMKDKIFFLKCCIANLSKKASLTYIEEEMKFDVILDTGCNNDCGLEIYVADINFPKRFIFVGQFIICFNNGFFNRQFQNLVPMNKAKSLLDYISCDEGGKVKEIYLLITEKSYRDLENHSTASILHELKSGKLSSAHAFEEICRLNGISCVTISGIHKETYTVAENFQDFKGHSWNAVFVNGSWKLIDCELSRKRKSCGKHSSSLDDYYFMPDPKELIYTHFPFDAKWQLLKPPLSHSDFQNLVRLKPAYFKNKLSMIQPTQSYLKVEGKACVTFEQNELDSCYSFLFVFLDDPKLKLDGYVMHYIEENLAVFNLRFPLRGVYHIVFYKKNLEIGYIDNIEEICEFEIENQGNDCLRSFPVTSCCWGATEFARKNSIKCFPSNPLIETTSETIDVSLSAPSHFKFYIKFTNNVGEAMNSIGFLRNEENHLKIIVKCPKVGEYCLRVYAIDVEDFGASICLVFQTCIVFYDVIFTADDSIQEIFLKASFGFLGSQPSNDYFGVIYLGNSDSLEPGGNVVPLQFLDGLGLNLNCKLLRVNCESSDDFSSFILKQRNNDINNFILSLPQEGVYVFQLFASECADELLNVYNVIINCKSVVNDVFKFPKQFVAWHGFLHQPLQRYINKDENSTMKFVFEISFFTSIYLVTEYESIPLTKGIDGCWSVNVNLCEFPHGCSVKVCACHDQEFHELLEFIVS